MQLWLQILPSCLLCGFVVFCLMRQLQQLRVVGIFFFFFGPQGKDSYKSFSNLLFCETETTAAVVVEEEEEEEELKNFWKFFGGFRCFLC